MEFFGTPSAEIDRNWADLIGRRYVSISEEEATRAWGDKRREYIEERLGGYTAGLDMFHNLHCVVSSQSKKIGKNSNHLQVCQNSLRKALRPEYYPGTRNAFHNGESAATFSRLLLSILALVCRTSDQSQNTVSI